jgi:hypothetical protein
MYSFNSRNDRHIVCFNWRAPSGTTSARVTRGGMAIYTRAVYNRVSDSYMPKQPVLCHCDRGLFRSHGRCERESQAEPMLGTWSKLEVQNMRRYLWIGSGFEHYAYRYSDLRGW